MQAKILVAQHVFAYNVHNKSAEMVAELLTDIFLKLEQIFLTMNSMKKFVGQKDPLIFTPLLKEVYPSKSVFVNPTSSTIEGDDPP